MDSNQPAVSVIIPIYNTAKWLPECLDSVLNQTRKDIEVICVDDCSTDPECRKIILDYQSRDARVVPLFLEKNGRQGIARNRGLEIARGRYAYFLDSDDYIRPETLETAYDTSERNALDVLFFNYENVFEEEVQGTAELPGVSTYDGEEYAGSVVTGEKLLEEFVSHNTWICYVQKQFWRTEYLRENGIHFLYCEHEDEYFSLTGISLAKRAMYIMDRLFIRRFRAGSVMTRPIGPNNVHGYLVNAMYALRFEAEHDIESWAYHRICINLTRCFSSGYGKLEDREQLTEWFKDPEERAFFEWFRLYREINESILCGKCLQIRTKIRPATRLGKHVIGRIKESLHVRGK